MRRTFDATMCIVTTMIKEKVSAHCSIQGWVALRGSSTHTHTLSGLPRRDRLCDSCVMVTVGHSYFELILKITSTFQRPPSAVSLIAHVIGMSSKKNIVA